MLKVTFNEKSPYGGGVYWYCDEINFKGLHEIVIVESSVENIYNTNSIKKIESVCKEDNLKQDLEKCKKEKGELKEQLKYKLNIIKEARKVGLKREEKNSNLIKENRELKQENKRFKKLYYELNRENEKLIGRNIELTLKNFKINQSNHNNMVKQLEKWKKKYNELLKTKTYKVNKETNLHIDYGLFQTYKCDCGCSISEHINYCPKCGVKLDWSDVNE